MAIKQIGTATEVITLAEAKVHLRLGSAVHPDDDSITGLISEAREWTESYIERSIGTQTLEIALDEFPSAFKLMPYVQSVTSITYLDVNGTLQTISGADYILDNYSSPCWVVPSYGKVWPETYEVANAVKIRFVSGYDAENTVPKPIIAAMRLIIGHLYENRQENVSASAKVSFNSLPMGVNALLQNYKLNVGL